MSEAAGLEGGCACGAVRYRLNAAPMFVNCCHCTSCQTETGSAFVINALIEADEVETTKGAAEPLLTPSESGRGQQIWRCPDCRVALWSNYGGAKDLIRFVRVGTLDDPGRASAGRPYLYPIEAALGAAAGGGAGVRGLLRCRAALARRELHPPQSSAGGLALQIALQAV